MYRKGKPKKRVFSITYNRSNKQGDDIFLENKKIGTIIKSFENESVAILKTNILPKIQKENISVNINNEKATITVHIPDILKNYAI